MIELLAPAGNPEAFAAALEAGADAIYLGGQQFGARQYASNFSEQELADCIRKAHLLGVRVYVTVNTLVDESEFPQLTEYLCFLHDVGADAAILQDIGVARLARRIVPQLPIHASTQMTVHDLAGVNFLADFGFERVILARELSLDEIGALCRQARCKIETFVHGALCICYSGQCLMSSMIGGRSGNRGRCAQPCRLPYQLLDSAGNKLLADQGVGEFLLSPKDFRTIEYMPELIKAGISSLKIEGRMKRPEYVAVVVDAYRRAIDRAYQSAEKYQVQAEDLRDLEQIFNRGFTSAHLFGKNGRNMMSDRRPNNRGVLIGRVQHYSASQRMVYLKLEGPLAPGDILEVWVKVGGRVTINVESIQSGDLPVEEATAPEEVSLYCPETVRPGDRVFKVFDARLTQKVQSWYAKPHARRRVPVTVTVRAAVDQPLVVEFTDREGNVGRAATQFIGQTARNRPLNPDILAEQCNRIGNTAFAIENFSADLKGAVMVPLSEINDARRRAVESLEEARLAPYVRHPVASVDKKITETLFGRTQPNLSSRSRPKLVVKVDSLEKTRLALLAGADCINISGEHFRGVQWTKEKYREAMDLVHHSGREMIFSLPRIIRETCQEKGSEKLNWFWEMKPDAVSAANIGSLAQALRHPGLDVHADYPLNLFNAQALMALKEMGATAAVLSPELNMGQIERLARTGIIPLECVVHGHLPLMLSEFCLPGSFLSAADTEVCSAACRQTDYFLQDRKGERFPVLTDDECRMHIFNGKEMSMLPHVHRLAEMGIDRLRIEAVCLNESQTQRITAAYRRAIDAGANGLPQQEIMEIEHVNTTRGHYFRGVL